MKLKSEVMRQVRIREATARAAFMRIISEFGVSHKSEFCKKVAEKALDVLNSEPVGPVDK